MGWIYRKLAVVVKCSGVSMRTMANEIWLGVGNNPSSHVNIVPGQASGLEYSRYSHDNQPSVSNQATVGGLSRWSTHLGCHGYNQFNV